MSNLLPTRDDGGIDWEAIYEDGSENPGVYTDDGDVYDMMTFARLVEQHTIERCAKVAEMRRRADCFDEMLAALEKMVEVHNEGCRLDHHGCCQEHYLDEAGECRVARALDAIAKAKGEKS